MTITDQVGALSPSTQPYSNQNNFGQIVGEVAQYNPSAGFPVVQNFVNNVVRDYYDRRLWYGLMIRGQIRSPGYYSTGSITLVNGSASVQGVGTGWTASIGGLAITLQQLHVSFIAPIFNIIALDHINQVITLDMPWGLPTTTTSGYFITENYYSIPNIKYIYSCKNLQMVYRMWTNVPQTLLENWDPSRLQLMYPRVLATMPPDTSGNYQVELWPAPNTQQAFPYLAYAQPPNLANDMDNLPPYIRADVIKAKAIAEVLLYRPKANLNYSEQTCVTIAAQKTKEYEMGVAVAAQADEQLYRQDIVTWAEQMPMANLDWRSGMLAGGAYGAAITPTMAGGGDE